jgi:hypothetical protein
MITASAMVGETPMADGSGSSELITALAQLLGSIGTLIGAAVTAWATVALRKNRNSGGNGGSNDRGR